MHKPHHGLARQPGPPLKPRRQVILMCPPGHFGVSYIINPWMDDQIGKVDRACATYQWENLRKILAQRADLVFIPPEPGLPDLVFTANAGLVLGDSVIVSRFSSAERRAEEPFIRAWFERSGFRIVPWPPAIAFEGAGDALIDRAMPRLWVGHSFRTDAAASAVLEQLTGLATIALNLVDPRFYHLDTCFCPLAGGWLLYYPAAFSDDSQNAIRALVPENKRIEVCEADALRFACNAIEIGANVIFNGASAHLQGRLRRAGFTPLIAPLSEFMRSGGAAKCLTLKLVEKAQEGALDSTRPDRAPRAGM